MRESYGNQSEVETWFSVTNFPHYEVSSLGRVRSLDRRVVQTNGVAKMIRGRLLKPQPQISGHLHIKMSEDGKTTMTRVHVLVAEAFIGPRPNGLLVCHLNGIPTDNRASNLYYTTKSQNAKDMYVHGRKATGEKSHLAKYKDSQVAEIRKLCGLISSRQAESITGVNARYIRKIWANEIRCHQA